MGVKIRKRGGKWYVFVNYHGRRKAKCVGTSRELAEQVRRREENREKKDDGPYSGGWHVNPKWSSRCLPEVR